MQASYGSYSLPENGVDVTQDIELVRNDAGRPYAQRVRNSVSGWLTGSGQSTLDTAARALTAALSVPYRDFKFLTDAGANTHLSLLNNNSISGVVVSGLSFPGTKKAEFATQREFRFQVEAEYPLGNTNNYILSFSETLAIRGGGPRYVILEGIAGLPQKQKVADRTMVSGQQSGEAIGYRAYPTPPPPLFPQHLLEAPEITKTSPRRVGLRLYEGFRITWNYTYGAVAGFSGDPTLWTG